MEHTGVCVWWGGQVTINSNDGNNRRDFQLVLRIVDKIRDRCLWPEATGDPSDTFELRPNEDETAPEGRGSPEVPRS